MTEHMTIPGWVHLSSGKVRDIYAPELDPHAASGPSELLMVTSDRISAYDVIMPTPIPDKGKVLNQLAIWWMRQMEDIVPNHLAPGALDVPAEAAGRAVVCRSLNMIPIECVVRGYLTGSGLVEYRQSGTVCGLPLPEGLTEASRLAEPIFTPAAKAELGDHDENISFERAAEMVGPELAERLRDLSIAVYSRARDIAAERGLILADTKFEFGLDPDSGEVVLADEILTPDSSRFWPADQWVEGQVIPSFDKQYLRDWLTSPASGWDRNAEDAAAPSLPDEVVAATRERYIEAFRRLTGEEPQL
ncbi:phosphoribosylaminoimidazolesuccinocarboxamide synthase [Schaalia sp. Marseille-Q2122]|uniref:phosphoribosylaminoimidazolesuccinocarboxamide synthase n=1 Tax=Schaalia sp. Marseille-Q2122 TaxID=2736604 RepID=UPI0020CA7864|nr:phosphoribosylaminoimidazolesuccinocarboxamide synthase [Schaalia sp. Marseille-Q2122]